MRKKGFRYWGNWLLRQLIFKLLGIILRIIDFAQAIPVRLYRILRHLGRGIGIEWKSPYSGDVIPHNQNKIHRAIAWWGVLVIYLLELFGIGEIYETITDFLKFNTRMLNQEEVKIAQSIFGSKINYLRLRIDESALLGPKQQSICYVSFYIINSWGKMYPSLFAHEMTHVWQYESMGAVYMVKALLAQHSLMGYNYGGLGVLKGALNENKSVLDFNLEQQGDIVADYYRIQHDQRPNWGNATIKDLETYRQILRTL